MPRIDRSILIPAEEVGIVHCYNRCVQQMTLCGIDPLNGRDCSARKTWMVEMLEEMTRAFAIDCLTYCFMDNHYHMLLRTRPDLVHGYSDMEVVRRWWALCPGERGEDGRAVEPEPEDLAPWLIDPVVVATLRGRLSSVSWLMQLYNGRSARRCNAECGRKGHFYEGRFCSKPLLEEAGVLACGLYIDLNKIRAKLATTPEQSVYTSANDRIASRIQRAARAMGLGCSPETMNLLKGLAIDVLAADPHSPDAFLAPVTLESERRLKQYLEKNFPSAGAIAWSVMEQLRKNATNTCDGSLQELRRLLVTDDAGYQFARNDAGNRDSVAATPSNGNADAAAVSLETTASSGEIAADKGSEASAASQSGTARNGMSQSGTSEGDPSQNNTTETSSSSSQTGSDRGNSPLEPSHSPPSPQLVQRPRPWHNSRQRLGQTESPVDRMESRGESKSSGASGRPDEANAAVPATESDESGSKGGQSDLNGMGSEGPVGDVKNKIDSSETEFHVFDETCDLERPSDSDQPSAAGDLPESLVIGKRFMLSRLKGQGLQRAPKSDMADSDGTDDTGTDSVGAESGAERAGTGGVEVGSADGAKPGSDKVASRADSESTGSGEAGGVEVKGEIKGDDATRASVKAAATRVGEKGETTVAGAGSTSIELKGPEGWDEAGAKAGSSGGVEQLNVEQSNAEQSNVEQSNVEQSNVEQSNVEQSNVEQSNVEQSNVEQSNVEQSNDSGNTPNAFEAEQPSSAERTACQSAGNTRGNSPPMRKPLPISLLLKRRKRGKSARNSSGSGVSNAEAQAGRKRASSVHWLDRFGESSMRSDPEDRSGRLPFPSARASNKGYLPMTLDDYLVLLDWTGRQMVPEKSGAIPGKEPPILARLGLKAEGFAEFVRKMGKVRRIAIGSHEAMVAMAARIGRKWLQNSHSMDGLFR